MTAQQTDTTYEISVWYDEAKGDGRVVDLNTAEKAAEYVERLLVSPSTVRPVESITVVALTS
jgi:hypothetical protein